jgi:hypothetical protein
MCLRFVSQLAEVIRSCPSSVMEGLSVTKSAKRPLLGVSGDESGGKKVKCLDVLDDLLAGVSSGSESDSSKHEGGEA